MAINYAARGKYVNYITPKPLTTAVLDYHDRKDLPVEALKKIHFRYYMVLKLLNLLVFLLVKKKPFNRYLKTYEELRQDIIRLWIDDAVSTVLLIDDLDYYITYAATMDDNMTEFFKAKLFSQILDSMRLCAKILKHQVFLIFLV